MKTNPQPTKTFTTIIGIDLGDKRHAVCITDEHGTIQREFFIGNRRTRLADLAKDHPGALLAMEVGTHSPWISRLMAAEGLEVLVANARNLRAIYANDRKCDELDARMLAKLARVDPELLSPVRHGSEASQTTQLAIKLRDTLVRRRVDIVVAVRSTLKSLGTRLPQGSTESFARRAGEALAQHPQFAGSVGPALQALESINSEIKRYDGIILRAGEEEYPVVQLLRQVPGVGPVTALSFVLTIEDPSRFKDIRDVGAFLGLVPRRDQSGASDRALPITKGGNAYLRKLLIQCAHYLLSSHGPDCALRCQGLKLAARGGRGAKKKALVATARKLAVLLLAMWTRESDFQPFPDGEAAAARA